ncbi:hypothetical protein BP6252_07173 [Coleophoma cylindrospora]|uniref:Cyanovirin-N domain-containing protein n=1 Tax=Coleophoma cylindrospora TaxID=1849047 RepID=A0A3D8RH41_9HELO|nr:hypothetical protein BP6252_07173 [Coleophoma cylindrospora]
MQFSIGSSGAMSMAVQLGFIVAVLAGENSTIEERGCSSLSNYIRMYYSNDCTGDYQDWDTAALPGVCWNTQDGASLAYSANCDTTVTVIYCSTRYTSDGIGYATSFNGASGCYTHDGWFTAEIN